MRPPPPWSYGTQSVASLTSSLRLDVHRNPRCIVITAALQRGVIGEGGEGRGRLRKHMSDELTRLEGALAAHG
eukprot:3712045-Pyramimonas_sp.AAC.1